MGLKICISNRFPGDTCADAAGLGTTVFESLCPGHHIPEFCLWSHACIFCMYLLAAHQVPGTMLEAWNVGNTLYWPLLRADNYSSSFTEKPTFTLSPPTGTVEDLVIPGSMLSLQDTER